MSRIRVALVGLLTLSASACPLLLARAPSAIVTERSVPVRMRDGTVLRADIYRPHADGRFPVLLTRTPYDKQDERDTCVAAAQRGYVAIAQDVRGRFESEGDWYPFTHESADGYDTVEWAAALPYANGKVGMFGSSYQGTTQFQAAVAHPPHLAGLFPGETGSDYHDGWIYQGGAFQQWLNESWTARVSLNTLERRLRNDTNPLSWVANFRSMRFRCRCPRLKRIWPGLRRLAVHPSDDAFWQSLSIEAHHDQIRRARVSLRGLVRPLPSGNASQLHGPEESRRERHRAPQPAPANRYWRPCGRREEGGRARFRSAGRLE